MIIDIRLPRILNTLSLATLLLFLCPGCSQEQTHIRPYQESDRQALVNIFEQNWEWLDYRPKSEGIADFIHDIDTATARSELGGSVDMTTLVYAENNITKGFISFFENTPTKAKILFLAVNEKYRRQNIARQLMNAALDELKQRGFHTIELTTLITNIKAQNLYRSFGFVEIGKSAPFIYFSKTT